MIDAALLAIELLVLILLLRRLRQSSKKGGLMNLGIFAYPDEPSAQEPQEPTETGERPRRKNHA